MIRKLTLLLLTSINVSGATADQIRYLFESMLAQSPDRALPGLEQVTDELRMMNSLTVEEVNSLFPLIQKCLHSSERAVSGYAITFFFRVAIRPDGGKLLDPYVDELLTLAYDSAGKPLRPGILTILADANPRLPARALTLLSLRLPDKTNSPQEALAISATLLKARPSDAAMIHKVLADAKGRDDTSLIAGVVTALSLERIQNPEALDFITDSLASANADIRAAAVEATGRYDLEVRSRFTPQLLRIANDEKETSYNKSAARAVLSK